MSYDTLKDGISGILKAQKYTESNQAFDFEDAGANEYENTFIIKALSGKNDEETSETLSSLIYDIQEWEIQIAFSLSALNSIVNRDEINRRRDILVKELDDPSNWTSYARIQKYIKWEIEERESYLVLKITLKVIDTVTY